VFFFLKTVINLKCLEKKGDKKLQLLIFVDNFSLVYSRRLWYYVCVVLWLLVDKFYLFCIREDIILNTVLDKYW
jgi:hypothetical protein